MLPKSPMTLSTAGEFHNPLQAIISWNNLTFYQSAFNKFLSTSFAGLVMH